MGILNIIIICSIFLKKNNNNKKKNTISKMQNKFKRLKWVDYTVRVTIQQTRIYILYIQYNSINTIK